MNERMPRASIIDKLPIIRQYKERKAKRETERAEEMSRKQVDNFLVGQGLSSYRHEFLKRNPELREKLGPWAAIITSPEGIALIHQYNQLAIETAPGSNMVAKEEAQRKANWGMSMYRIRDWLENTPLKDHPSLEAMEVIMRLGLLARGPNEYYRHRIIENYLKSSYFEGGKNVKKLLDLPMIIERVNKTAASVDASVVFRAFERWFEVPGQKDLTFGTVSQFCGQLEAYSAELRKRGGNHHWWVIEHYIPVMFANNVCPEAVAPTQLRTFLDGLMDLSAKEKVNETAIVRTLVPALTCFPAFQNSLSIEMVQKVVSDLKSLTNVNPGNLPALIYSLFDYKNNVDTANVTAENWHQTVGRRYDELATAAGRGSREAFGTLKGFSRILDLNTEWETMTQYVSKYVRGSTLDFKTLARMAQVQETALPLLRNALDHKPASLVKIVRMLEVANLFDIKLDGIYGHLTPLQKLPPEQLDALLKRDGGESKLERRFKRLQHKNDRSDKAKGIDSLVTRLASARSRSDRAAEQQLVSELTMRFANEYQLYFERFFNEQIVKKARTEFGVSFPDNERVHSDVFMRSYEMYRRLTKTKDYSVTDSDRALAKKLIASYLEGKTDFVTNEPTNAAWLGRRLPESASLWLSANEREFDASKMAFTSNVEKRQQHFFAIAVRLLQELDPNLNTASMNPQELVQAFRALEPDSYTPQQDALYQDLKVQVRGLEQTHADAYAGERPQKVRIMRETDPGVALMLGTWVSGSCYDASGMNYWASFPDAMEANKGIFWIKDEKDRILGRVLMAIDKNNKLVVFPTYYAGLGVDLDSYVDEYAQDLAHKLGIEVNGNAQDVERLLWSRWTSDFERKIRS